MKSVLDDSIDVARTPLPVRIVKYWVPVAMMTGVMFYFSTDVFSAENTRVVFDKFFLWFVPHANRHTLVNFNYLLRKSAHFTEYAILGVLLFRAFRADNPVRWRFKWALYAFISTVSWALLDEIHQTFTRTRGGSIWDSLLDASGGLFSLALIAMYYTRNQTPRSS
jgi:VanZ family protein